MVLVSRAGARMRGPGLRNSSTRELALACSIRAASVQTCYSPADQELAPSESFLVGHSIQDRLLILNLYFVLGLVVAILSPPPVPDPAYMSQS